MRLKKKPKKQLSKNHPEKKLISPKQKRLPKRNSKEKKKFSADAVLPAGPTYVVIPCTFNPGCEGGFTISFTAEVSLNLAPLPPSKEWKVYFSFFLFLFFSKSKRLLILLSSPQKKYQYISCLGSWESRSAGGCRNHPSCIRNPQFLLRVRRSGDFTILLSQVCCLLFFYFLFFFSLNFFFFFDANQHKQTKEKFDAVGFYVVATKDPEFMLTEINSSDIVAKADFARPSEAIVTASLDKKVQVQI